MAPSQKAMAATTSTKTNAGEMLAYKKEALSYESYLFGSCYIYHTLTNHNKNDFYLIQPCLGPPCHMVLLPRDDGGRGGERDPWWW